MAPNKSSSKKEKKEGGIDVNPTGGISDSEFVGRDRIEGIPGKEVIKIIETLLKYFPKGYLQNPDELDKTLCKIQRYHEQLHEYKELHNAIGEILVAFGPFDAEINHSNFNRKLPKLSLLRDLWRPVSLRVTSLLNWSRSIRTIGKPFQELEDKSKSGELWAIQFSELQNQINGHLGISNQLCVLEINYPSHIQKLSFKVMRVEIPWWLYLCELTSSFNHTSDHHMNSADKQLRQTAQELYNLSNKALSNY